MSTLKENAWPRPDLRAMMANGFEPGAAKWIRSLWDEIAVEVDVSMDLYVSALGGLGVMMREARSTEKVAEAIATFRRQQFTTHQNVVFDEVVPAMRALGARACRLLNPDDFESIANYFDSRYKVWGDVLAEDAVKHGDLSSVYQLSQTEMSKAIFAFLDTVNLSERDFLFDGYCGLRVGNHAGFDRAGMQIVLPSDGTGAALAWFEALDWRLYDTLYPNSDIPGPLTRALTLDAPTAGHGIASSLRRLVDLIRSTQVEGDALMLRAQQGLTHSMGIFRSVAAQIQLDAEVNFTRDAAESFRLLTSKFASRFSTQSEKHSTEWLLANYTEAWEKSFGERMPVKLMSVLEAAAIRLKKSSAKVAGIRSGQIAFTIERTNYHLKAARMDEVSGKDFWSTPSFMASRAFMAWTADKAGNGDAVRGPAFPEGQERHRINQAVGEFFMLVAPLLQAEQRPQRRQAMSAGL